MPVIPPGASSSAGSRTGSSSIPSIPPGPCGSFPSFPSLGVIVSPAFRSRVGDPYLPARRGGQTARPLRDLARQGRRRCPRYARGRRRPRDRRDFPGSELAALRWAAVVAYVAARSSSNAYSSEEAPQAAGRAFEPVVRLRFTRRSSRGARLETMGGRLRAIRARLKQGREFAKLVLVGEYLGDLSERGRGRALVRLRARKMGFRMPAAMNALLHPRRR
jgi:hypothetical protein